MFRLKQFAEAEDVFSTCRVLVKWCKVEFYCFVWQQLFVCLFWFRHVPDRARLTWT